MRMVRARWGALPVAAVLCLALLSGCSGSPAADAGDDADPASQLDLQATETTGVIRGVVVDDAIRPIANATVTARGAGPERTASTSGDGAFGFEGLEPGTWFVSAEKLAHKGGQASVEVDAGVDDPPLVKLLLVFVPGAAPFVTEAKVEAFVQCIIPGANVCAIVNLYPCILAGLCDPTMEDTSFDVLHDEIVPLQRTPDWLQTEIVWESTQAATPGLGIQYSNYDAAAPGRGETSSVVRGHSPLLYSMAADTLGEWGVGTTKGIGHEIFGHMDETSAVGSLGFVVNQRVDFFFDVFYGYTPPEGWRLSVDGPAQPPR
ncbi:MAG: Carboxypeptidase regulatory-like domain [Thermoplasmata archaeon]|nr:Carboxypeptidase regulatory-like domain [Thermoplasmata archaeon]